MTKIIRRANDRGFFDHGWLKTHHSFSFGEYHDENFMNFASLRVINEDYIAAQKGFGFHPHQSMEIITFVLRGTLTHLDNLGNREEIGAGCFQIMSAGDGITHSEFNYGNEEVHLLQIWIKPNKKGGAPSYKIFKPEIEGRWALVAANVDNQNSGANFLQMKQDACVYAIDSQNLREINLPKITQEKIWLQVALGNIELDDGTKLNAGDGLGINASEIKKIIFHEKSKLVLFGLN